MAGSLDGRARRVRRLEARTRGPARPATSRTLEEARALEAEIRALEAEMAAPGGPAADPELEALMQGMANLPLDEQIELLEEEIARCPGD